MHPSSVSLRAVSPTWKKRPAQVVSPGRMWGAPLGLLLLALPAPGLTLTVSPVRGLSPPLCPVASAHSASLCLTLRHTYSRCSLKAPWIQLVEPPELSARPEGVDLRLCPSVVSLRMAERRRTLLAQRRRPPPGPSGCSLPRTAPCRPHGLACTPRGEGSRKVISCWGFPFIRAPQDFVGRHRGRSSGAQRAVSPSFCTPWGMFTLHPTSSGDDGGTRHQRGWLRGSSE